MKIRFAVPPAAWRGRLARAAARSSSEDRCFGRKLFIDAQASISVPSTEK
jgi:hypothetical protein